MADIFYLSIPFKIKTNPTIQSSIEMLRLTKSRKTFETLLTASRPPNTDKYPFLITSITQKSEEELKKAYRVETSQVILRLYKNLKDRRSNTSGIFLVFFGLISGLR